MKRTTASPTSSRRCFTAHCRFQWPIMLQIRRVLRRPRHSALLANTFSPYRSAFSYSSTAKNLPHPQSSVDWQFDGRDDRLNALGSCSITTAPSAPQWRPARHRFPPCDARFTAGGSPLQSIAAPLPAIAMGRLTSVRWHTDGALIGGYSVSTCIGCIPLLCILRSWRLSGGWS